MGNEQVSGTEGGLGGILQETMEEAAERVGSMDAQMFAESLAQVPDDEGSEDTSSEEEVSTEENEESGEETQTEESEDESSEEEDKVEEEDEEFAKYKLGILDQLNQLKKAHQQGQQQDASEQAAQQQAGNQEEQMATLFADIEFVKSEDEVADLVNDPAALNALLNKVRKEGALNSVEIMKAGLPGLMAQMMQTAIPQHMARIEFFSNHPELAPYGDFVGMVAGQYIKDNPDETDKNKAMNNIALISKTLLTKEGVKFDDSQKKSEGKPKVKKQLPKQRTSRTGSPAGKKPKRSEQSEAAMQILGDFDFSKYQK